MVIGIDIAQEHRYLVHVGDNNIDFAVVEYISECASSTYTHCGESGAFHRWREFELSVLQVAKQERALSIRSSRLSLIDCWVDMPVDDQKIFPSVIVVVEKSVSETNERHRRRRNASLIAHICKVSTAVVSVENVVVVGERSTDQVEMTIVFVVPGGEAHICDFATIFIDSQAARV